MPAPYNLRLQKVQYEPKAGLIIYDEQIDNHRKSKGQNTVLSIL